ncbi:MAG: zinc ribbon domain-containing protein [Clostridia bacterium]
MFCKKCGTKNDSDSIFCLECGNRLISENQNSVKQPYEVTPLQNINTVSPFVLQNEVDKKLQNSKKKRMNIIALIGAVIAVLGLFLPLIDVKLLSHSETFTYIGIIETIYKQYEFMQKFSGDIANDLLVFLIISLVPVLLTALCFFTSFFKGKTTMIFAILAFLSTLAIGGVLLSEMGDLTSIIDMFAKLSFGAYVFFGGLLINIIAKIFDKKIV